MFHPRSLARVGIGTVIMHDTETLIWRGPGDVFSQTACSPNSARPARTLASESFRFTQGLLKTHAPATSSPRRGRRQSLWSCFQWTVRVPWVCTALSDLGCEAAPGSEKGTGSLCFSPALEGVFVCFVLCFGDGDTWDQSQKALLT